MKTRAIFLLLCLCVLLNLLPTVSAAEQDTVEDLQQAIVETALAYYYKGPYVQYDSTPMTAQDRMAGGESRFTPESPPEWAADDNTLFTVCSNYVYCAVYNAIGYKLTGGSRTCITNKLAQTIDPDTPGLIFLTGGSAGTYDPEAAVASKSLLQPGDVLTYFSTGRDSGHSVLYVGEALGSGKGVFLNANGRKINLSTGADQIDNEPNSLGGAVRLDGYSSHFYGKGTYADVSDPSKVTAFSIIRPALAAKQQGLSLTPASRTRLRFRGIEVSRTSDVKKYHSVRNGDEIHIAVTVTNHGTSDFVGVPVREALPVGGSVDGTSVTGGVLSGDGIAAEWNVPAGGSVTLEYTVTVTARRGETVRIPSGAVGDLTTRPLEFRVGGEPLDGDALAELRSADGLRRVQTQLDCDGDLDFVNEVYREFFGVDPGLPETIREFRDGQLKWATIPGVSLFGGQMLWAKKDGELTETARRCRQMILPDHMAGYCVYLRDTVDEVPDTVAAQNRVLEIKREFYQPGDVFFGYEHQSGGNRDVYQPELFLYLGGDDVLGFTDGSDPAFYTFGESVGLLLREDVLFAVRPTLVYDNINNVNVTPGDVDGDGEVSGKDVTALRRYIVGGYGLTANETVADVNHDGAVNGKDVTTLRRYLVGGYGVDIGAPSVVAVSSVTLNRTNVSLTAGKSATLTAEVLPANATEKTVTWTSSAPAIATVDGGVITAVSVGTAVVTASAGGRTATCAVTVLENSGGDNRLPGIPID